jgi:hypothetical protein
LERNDEVRRFRFENEVIWAWRWSVPFSSVGVSISSVGEGRSDRFKPLSGWLSPQSSEVDSKRSLRSGEDLRATEAAQDESMSDFSGEPSSISNEGIDSMEIDRGDKGISAASISEKLLSGVPALSEAWPNSSSKWGLVKLLTPDRMSD